MDLDTEIVELTSAQLDRVSGGLDFSALAAKALAGALERNRKILIESSERTSQVTQK